MILNCAVCDDDRMLVRQAKDILMRTLFDESIYVLSANIPIPER